MITLDSEPPSATMKTASLSPPSPDEQDTPRPNLTKPPSKSVTSMGALRVDSPAAVGKVPEAVEPPLLGVLGAVELDEPPELPPEELPPEPEEDSSSPDPEELSSSPEPESESEEDSSLPVELSSSPVSSSPDPEDVSSSPELESSEVLSSPELVSSSSELLSSSS